MAKANNVKALIFDVFGTVVDWRTSIKKGVANIIPKKSITNPALFTPVLLGKKFIIEFCDGI